MSDSIGQGKTTFNYIQQTWVVERLNNSGEELSVIRHKRRWFSAPVALRYALRIRFLLGASTLTADMRAISIAYNWAEHIDEIGNLEDFLTSGQVLSREQLQQLIICLHQHHERIVGEGTQIGIVPVGIVCNQVFNSRLFAVRRYLEWAIEPTNNGGRALLDEDEIEAQKAKLIRLFEKAQLPVGESHRLQPLSIAEVKLIRRAIGPNEFGVFPSNIFAEETRNRNWVMFETALNLGTRKAELLTLKGIHLPADPNDARIFIPRQQDASEDPRIRRRLRGKTNERRVPLMDPALLPVLLRYRDSEPPVGRNYPNITTPYLFVTVNGDPVSSSTADYIIKQIGIYAARLLDEDKTLDEYTRVKLRESMLSLSWHRLRHTWAEQAALSLYRKHGEAAWPILQDWGGWNSRESLEHYIQNARRIISNEAARAYQSSYRGAIS